MAWSRKKLTGLAVLIFAGQIGVIFALHTREPLRARIGMLSPTRPGGFATNSVGTEMEELNDPLAFAGAHEQGFSAHAWMKRPQMELSMSNSISPPAFLEFQRARIEIPSANQIRSIAPELPFVRLAISNPPPIELPVIAQGSIANRPLLTKIIPPPQAGPELSSNTVVQVAIQADGFPFTARILSSSGSRAADLTALQLARDAKFAAAIDAPLQWGELVFQWQMAPPPATNAPAPAGK